MSRAALRGREVGSAGSLVLAVTAFLVLAVAYLQLSHLPATPFWIVVGDVGFVGLIAGVLVLGILAFSRTRASERQLWGLVTALYAVLLLSEVVWLWIIVATGSPPPPVNVPFFILNSIAALLYLAVVASLTPLAGSHRIVRARQLLDVVSFGVVIYVMAFFLSVVPLFSGVPGATPADGLTGAIFPTWGVMMVAGLTWPLLVTGRGLLRGSWQRLLWMALLAYALAVGLWPLWFTAVMGSGGGDEVILEVVQQLSHYLLLLALILRLQRPQERWTPPRPVGTPRPFARVIAYLMVAFVMVAMPIMIALAILAPVGSVTRLVLGISAALLAVLTVVRTVLTASESGRLFRSSMTDPLTGLSNHRHFHEQLRSAVEYATRFDGALAVMVFDLDGFDQVNSRHGHPAGDELLRRVGAALRDACGDSGAMCRVGGDEFAAVLPEGDAETALSIAVSARRNLASVCAPDGVPVTASCGIAIFPEHADDAAALLRLADGAAYWVKRHGKDQAIVYTPSVVRELGPEDLVAAAERQAESGVVRALAAAVDARHEHTSTHSVAVSGWATDVARRLGLAEDRIRMIETAALLHDVGMIAVAEGVFGKVDSLAELEVDQIRMHPVLSARIISETMPEAVVAAVRHHHERWDGEGYPDGLRAVEIPLEARILQVCGAYDAMTSPRPFRSAFSVTEAASELRAGAGTQFDPEIVESFLAGLGAMGLDEPRR